MCRFLKPFPIIVVLSLISFSSSAAEVSADQRNQIFNEAIAEALTLVYEEASGIPASSISQMAGQLSAGDYSGGILTAASIATDTAIGLIPVVGQVKFLVGLESAVIKIGKTYLDNYMVDIAWAKFKTLSTTDQDAWINGDDVAEMTYGLGDYYLSRNVTDLRSLFKVYRDNERQKAATMSRAAALIDDLDKAQSFSAAEVYSPSEGAEVTYSSSLNLEWWAYGANYFKITLSVGGSSYSQTVKVDPYDVTPTIPLSQFGIDWDTIFEENTAPVNVTWKVDSARYDSTGVLEAVYGSEMVIASSKLIHIEGYDSVKQSGEFSFKINPDAIPISVNITSPDNNHETSDNNVTVTAQISTENGSSLPEISKVGFVVNGEVQYSTLSGDSFSTVAVLKTGDNSIKAGAITSSDNKVYLSDAINVTSNALNNTYHIRISWDKNDTDVDLHFSWSGGSTCYYSNKNPTWGDSSTSPTLDVDNTEGYGPENITIDSLPGDGTYKIWVYYYSDHDNGGTNVYATINKDGQSIFSSSRYMTDGGSWTLMEFTIP